MLAERVKKWTRELKEEGRQEGLQKGLQKGLQEGRQEGRQEGIRAFQEFLLSEMAERFGPVPAAIRRRIKAVQDLDELKTLGKRLLAAGSLDDLGL